MNYDQKNYEKAIVYFERSFAELEKVDASEESPHAYADLLDEYSISLQKVGNSQASEAAMTKASKLRKENPEGHSTTDRTPYGTQCSER